MEDIDKILRHYYKNLKNIKIPPEALEDFKQAINFTNNHEDENLISGTFPQLSEQEKQRLRDLIKNRSVKKTSS